MPRARSIRAVVRPPIPPPTIIAFIARYSTQNRAFIARLGCHGPSLRRKRLGTLRLQLNPGFRLSLNLEVLEILPVAHAIAENLLLSWHILRRAERIRAVPGRRLYGERRIDQMRPAERDEVGTAGGEDRVDLIRRGDVTDTHGGDAGLVANLIGERRLEHATIDRLGIAHGLSRGN